MTQHRYYYYCAVSLEIPILLHSRVTVDQLVPQENLVILGLRDPLAFLAHLVQRERKEIMEHRDRKEALVLVGYLGTLVNKEEMGPLDLWVPR